MGTYIVRRTIAAGLLAGAAYGGYETWQTAEAAARLNYQSYELGSGAGIVDAASEQRQQELSDAADIDTGKAVVEGLGSFVLLAASIRLRVRTRHMDQPQRSNRSQGPLYRNVQTITVANAPLTPLRSLLTLQEFQAQQQPVSMASQLASIAIRDVADGSSPTATFQKVTYLV